MSTREVDIAVVGSGFAGSILAMIARRLGKSVVLLERGHHPRFAIGESSTPLAALLLESIARRYDLPRLLPFTKYGAWKRSYPDVGCGLKRGFSFFRHRRGQPFTSDDNRRDQLLVAASPHDEIGDVHWYRPDFDHFLVREAAAMGAEYLDGVALTTFERRGDRTHLGGTRGGEPVEFAARLVVDATGPRGFLHRQLSLGQRELPGLLPAQALFSHFTGVRLFTDVAPGAFAGTPPYAPDAAAVHHVLDGGWIWVLRFDNGVTSAGVAATDALANDVGLSDGAASWDRLLARYPSVAAQFADAKPTLPFVRMPRLAFSGATVSGDGWVMLPSAAGIVDPLLSTGFPLTLLGIERVAAALAEAWDSPRLGLRLAEYAARTQAELDVTARLVGALYGAFDDWEGFTALAHLYFAAASFAESARRIGHGELAGDAFMLGGHAHFVPALERCLAIAHSGAGDLPSAVADAIEPVNVAGLHNPARRNWYPCDAADIMTAAGKLRASEGEVVAMLKRCGFKPGRG